jgi:hypothetical protein
VLLIDWHVHHWAGPEFIPQQIWDTFPAVRRRTDYQEADVGLILGGNAARLFGLPDAM